MDQVHNLAADAHACAPHLRAFLLDSLEIIPTEDERSPRKGCYTYHNCASCDKLDRCCYKVGGAVENPHTQGYCVCGTEGREQYCA